MVSGNTETGVTVTYDDSDNTLDFVFTGTADTTGNAATATALETARTIHGVSFDGTANIDLSEVIQDTVGAMVSSNTESGITVAYEDSDGTLDFTVGTLNQDTTGNSATATALETARTIHGVSFDGSANIDLSEVIQDTVGAMVSSNTETGIGVTYEDGDGTLDFVIGSSAITNAMLAGSIANSKLANSAITVSDGSNSTATSLGGTITFSGTSNEVEVAESSGTVTVGLPAATQVTTSLGVGGGSTNGVQISQGAIAIKNGGTQSYVDFYCESSNAHYARLQAPAHSAFSGNITLTLPATTDTLVGKTTTDTLTNKTLSAPAVTGTATFAGDVNVDSGLLFADVSTNRIGINQASPDVSLDLGANTDSIHVPVGTTAQRPSSPAAGYFRYNSTTGGFEGYTDAWGAIAGGGGTAPSIDTMTGDGSDTTLSLSTSPVNENATFVTIDGVLQHKSTYSVSGSTLTFSEAPPDDTAVECITLNATSSTTANILQDADSDTKIQVEESSDEDKIRFDTGGTERMVIDNNGNVGIGTTSPNQKLEVNGNILLSNNQEIRFKDSGGNERTAFSLNSSNDLNIGTSANGNLKFINGSSYTERMRIDSSGNLLVGKSSTAIDANGIVLGATGSCNFICNLTSENESIIYNNNNNSGAKYVHDFRQNGTSVGKIEIGSSTTAYLTSSDYRLKENVDYTWDATTRLKQLKPCRFNWIADDTNTLIDGFLAHEVSSIVPEAISGDKDAVDSDNNPKYQGIDQSKLIPLLVKTIQELEARIKTLEEA